MASLYSCTRIDTFVVISYLLNVITCQDEFASEAPCHDVIIAFCSSISVHLLLVSLQYQTRRDR